MPKIMLYKTSIKLGCVVSEMMWGKSSEVEHLNMYQKTQDNTLEVGSTEKENPILNLS